MRSEHEAVYQGYAQAVILAELVAELYTWQLDALLNEARDMAEEWLSKSGRRLDLRRWPAPVDGRFPNRIAHSQDLTEAALPPPTSSHDPTRQQSPPAKPWQRHRTRRTGQRTTAR
jgi:hypothetical protein